MRGFFWASRLVAYLAAIGLASCACTKEDSFRAEGNFTMRGIAMAPRETLVSGSSGATAMANTSPTAADINVKSSAVQDPKPKDRSFFKPCKEQFKEYADDFMVQMATGGDANFLPECFSITCGDSFVPHCRLSENDTSASMLTLAWELLQAGDEADCATRRKFLDNVIFKLAEEEELQKRRLLYDRIKIKCTEKRSSSSSAESRRPAEAPASNQSKNILTTTLVREAFVLVADLLTPAEVCRMLSADVFVGLLLGNFRAIEQFVNWSDIQPKEVERIFIAQLPTRHECCYLLTEAEAERGKFSYELSPFKLPRFLATASSKVVLRVLESMEYDISSDDFRSLVASRGGLGAVASDTTLSADLMFQAMKKRALLLMCDADAISLLNASICKVADANVPVSLLLAPCFEAVHDNYRSTVGRLPLLRTALQALVAFEVVLHVLLADCAPLSTLLNLLNMRLEHVEAIFGCLSDCKDLIENKALAHIATTPLSFLIRKAFKAIRKPRDLSEGCDREFLHIVSGLESVLDADQDLLAKSYPRMFSEDPNAFDSGIVLLPIQELLISVSLNSSPTAVSICWLMSKGLPWPEILHEKMVVAKVGEVCEVIRNLWHEEVLKNTASQAAVLPILRATFADEIRRKVPELAGNKDALNRLELLAINCPDFDTLILGAAGQDNYGDFDMIMRDHHCAFVYYSAFLECQRIALRHDHSTILYIGRKGLDDATLLKDTDRFVNVLLGIHLEAVRINGYICQLGPFLAGQESPVQFHETVFAWQLEGIRSLLEDWSKGPLFTSSQIGRLLKLPDPIYYDILSTPYIYRNLSTFAEFTPDNVMSLNIDLEDCKIGLYTCSEEVILNFLRRKEGFLFNPNSSLIYLNRRLWQSQDFRSVAWELLSLPILVEYSILSEEVKLTDLIADQVSGLMSFGSGPEAVRELIWVLARLAVLHAYNYRIADLTIEMEAGRKARNRALSLEVDSWSKVEKALKEVRAYGLGSTVSSEGGSDCDLETLEWLFQIENWMSSEMRIANYERFREMEVNKVKEQSSFDAASRLNSPVLVAMNVPEDQRKEALMLFQELDLSGFKSMEKLQAIIEMYAPTDLTRYVWTFRAKCCTLTRFRHIFPEEEAHRKRSFLPEVLTACTKGLVPLMDATIAYQTCSLLTINRLRALRPAWERKGDGTGQSEAFERR